MECCTSCFSDSFLSEQIRFFSKKAGQCHFCKSRDSSLVACSLLTDIFVSLLDIYTVTSPGEEGEPLSTLLKEDWQLFNRLDDHNATLLLQAILEHNFDPGSHYTRLDPDESIISQWEDFHREIKEQNRFFPRTFIELDEKSNLRDLLPHLSIKVDDFLQDNVAYRARKQPADRSWETKDLGPPPVGVAPGGRANPYGIPYLYLASDPETVAAELRPHVGEKLAIAKFYFNSSETLNLIDLLDPRVTISPFDPPSDLRKLVSDIKLLRRLGEDLSKPVSRELAHLEYLPSQFLCEYIKSLGFDGVVYDSALADGFNIAIFNYEELGMTWFAEIEISRVNIEFL